MRNLMEDLNSDELITLREHCYNITGEWIPFNWDEFGSIEDYTEYLKNNPIEFVEQKPQLIYKILREIENSMDVDCFDEQTISAESLNLSKAKWIKIMTLLLTENYVTGIKLSEKGIWHDPWIEFISPEITLRGLEYLEENSSLEK